MKIFGENGVPYSDKNPVCPCVMFEKLTSFIDTYTGGSESFAVAKEAFNNVYKALSFEKRELALDEAVSLAKELLDGSKISDSEDSSAVKVELLTRRSVLERPNVYVIGLALKDMRGNTAESPALLDEEKENYLKMRIIQYLI